MRRFPIILSCLLCCAVVMAQVSGLHLHASSHPENQGLHGSHVHGAGPDGHDHAADVDVSVFELGTAWAKLAALLIVSSLLLRLPVLRAIWAGGSPGFLTLKPRRLPGWLPPLRAPPRPF